MERSENKTKTKCYPKLTLKNERRLFHSASRAAYTERSQVEWSGLTGFVTFDVVLKLCIILVIWVKDPVSSSVALNYSASLLVFVNCNTVKMSYYYRQTYHTSLYPLHWSISSIIFLLVSTAFILLHSYFSILYHMGFFRNGLRAQYPQ